MRCSPQNGVNHTPKLSSHSELAKSGVSDNDGSRLPNRCLGVLLHINACSGLAQQLADYCTRLSTTAAVSSAPIAPCNFTQSSNFSGGTLKSRTTYSRQ